MPSEVVSTAVTVRSNPGLEAARAAAATPAPPPAAVIPAATPPGNDLRLNIVHDQASGLFVYKFIDPTTGHVVQQFPDEAMIKLRTAAEYAAGRLISTRV